jgi:hypothetical protein
MPSIPGFCGTCHDTPNVGNHSVSAPLDIGIADAGDKAPPALVRKYRRPCRALAFLQHQKNFPPLPGALQGRQRGALAPGNRGGRKPAAST